MSEKLPTSHRILSLVEETDHYGMREGGLQKFKWNLIGDYKCSSTYKEIMSQ